VTQARRQLADVEGAHDEVVEEVLAERQVVELEVVDEEDNRSDTPVPGAQLAAEAHGLGEGEGHGVDHGAGEAVGRLERGDLVHAARHRHRRGDPRDFECLANRPLARGHAEHHVDRHSSGR
jgi:hypothetical protein